MNEQIKKALTTVGFEFRHDEEYGQVLENFTLRDAEKFAELIVRECANIDFRARVGLSREDDREVSRVIKEHFGVES